MKLASLKAEKSANRPDGRLAVVSRDLGFYVLAEQVAPSLREAIESWEESSPKLQSIYEDLNAGKLSGKPLSRSDKSLEFQAANYGEFHSCLPRTWLFADGSAFIHHIKLVRKSRQAPLPETLETVPLMYQGECGEFLDPSAAIPQRDFSHGTDFEAEVGVITDRVPMGISPEAALKHIILITLINDVSLRGLIPAELVQGFGFFQSKPASSLAPLAVTPDELGLFWKKGRVELPLNVRLNGKFFGQPNAKEMHFHFGELIAHAAKTRNLVPGTLIGSGTVSNENSELGSGCLAEKRTLEQIRDGQATTPFLKEGDQVEIWMEDPQGRDLFGRINQTVRKI